MKIKASDTLKGELVLASVKKSLRAGQEINILDSAYWNEDVQISLNTGRIIVTNNGGAETTMKEETLVVIQCIHSKAIALPSLGRQLSSGRGTSPLHAGKVLAPGETCSINKKQLLADDIQQALELNLILVLGEDGPVEVAGSKKIKDVDGILNALEGGVPTSDEAALEVDIVDEDIAERFKRTGQAQTIHRPAPTRAFQPYDPRDQADASAAASAKIAGVQKVATATKPSAPPRPKGNPNHPFAKAAAATEVATKTGTPKRTIKPIGGARGAGGDDLGGDGIEIEML